MRGGRFRVLEHPGGVLLEAPVARAPRWPRCCPHDSRKRKPQVFRVRQILAVRRSAPHVEEGKTWRPPLSLLGRGEQLACPL